MSKQSDFINLIAPIVQKEAFKRGYNFPSAVIAQAILESGWGDSALAKNGFNYFGMKSGKSWKGKTQLMKTQEQRPDGSYYTITASFRAYNSPEQGISGYFDFISATRYLNLRNATSSRDYLEKIKNDGYATSIKYVENVYRVVKANNLEKYDKVSDQSSTKVPENMNELDVQAAINIIAKCVINGRYGNGIERKENLYKEIQKRVNELCK